MAHLPRVPDLNAQRAAMGKLGFLVGKWNGEARLLRGTGEWVISFDDQTATYRMRAFNDGRFLESEVTLLDRDKAISWGFAVGQVTTKSVLRINESGEWTELAEIKIGSALPKRLLELTVRRAN